MESNRGIASQGSDQRHFPPKLFPAKTNLTFLRDSTHKIVGFREWVGDPEVALQMGRSPPVPPPISIDHPRSHWSEPSVFPLVSSIQSPSQSVYSQQTSSPLSAESLSKETRVRHTGIQGSVSILTWYPGQRKIFRMCTQAVRVIHSLPIETHENSRTKIPNPKTFVHVRSEFLMNPNPALQVSSYVKERFDRTVFAAQCPCVGFSP